MKKKIRVALALEANLYRCALCALLDQQEQLETVGTADTLERMARLMATSQADVLVCEIALGDIPVFGAIRELSHRFPGTGILVLTLQRAASSVQLALRAGAAGYVLKDASTDDLFAGIQAVARGQNFLGAGIPLKLMSDEHERVEERGQRPQGSRLTLREREVLAMVAEGLSSRVIADTLSLSAKTIAKHRANLMRKLDLHNVAALTRYAHESGLVAEFEAGAAIAAARAGAPAF